MFSRFSEEAQKALINAKREMKNLRHPYVGSEHLFLSILSMKDLEITKVLASYNITYEIFKKELIRIVGVGKESNEWFLYTPLLKRVIETAILNSKEKGEVEVSVNELLLAILEEGEGVAIRLLIGLNIDVDEIYNSISKDSKVSNKALHKKLLVEDFAVNLNKKVISNEVDPVIGRDDEIKSLTDGYGCDVYIEATGNPDSVVQGLSIIRRLGRFVEFSVFSKAVTVDWSIIGDKKELDILGSHLSPHTYPFVIEQLGKGALNTDGIVTRKFKLEQWEKAFDYATGKYGDLKVAFTFDV